MDRRGDLAVERTRPANERTVLANVQTALALVGGGVGVLYFFEFTLWRVLGWALSVTGITLFRFGLYRFRRVAGSLRRTAHPPGVTRFRDIARGAVLPLRLCR